MKMLHLRRHHDSPVAAAAYCGVTNRATITDAWGYFGPGGNGWDEVCKDCVTAKQKNGSCSVSSDQKYCSKCVEKVK